jgi:ribA/ribD-fused uncharacterized protein
MSSNWFSNFNPYPRPITDRATGITYRTPEHLYQAAKTLDIEQRRAVAACATPGQAKRMGRKVTMRPDWDTLKFDVMVYCQTKMVEQDPAYAQRLKQSSDADLVEWNTWHDNTWGQCTCTRCQGKLSQNLLQNALIQVRDAIA